MSKAQVLEGEVILGQYLATENVEQVNDLFSHLWIKMHLYFLINFICFAAESKIQKSIFNHSACPLHPPTLDEHCDIGLAGPQDCHYAGDHCCCGRCFSSFVFSCVLDSESGNSTWQTTICPANGCGSNGELSRCTFFLSSTNPLSLSQVRSPHRTSLTTIPMMLQEPTSSKCKMEPVCHLSSPLSTLSSTGSPAETV